LRNLLKEIQMNRYNSVTESLTWLIALLLAAVVAGCGGGSGSPTVPATSSKAFTSYSFASAPGATGTIDETAKTISVTVANATSVTALRAIFTTTGASVKVGTLEQVSGTTPNNFTSPVAYIVTAANASAVTYTVTVHEAALGSAAVNLLTAGDFTILANTAVTYNGTAAASAVTGDVGISPAAASYITGFSVFAVDAKNDFATAAEVVPVSGVAASGRMYAPDYTGGQIGSTNATPAKMTAAQNDMVTAYNDARLRTAGTGAYLDAGTGGSIGGLSLTPGVYTWATNSNVTIPSNVTLTGNATDIWIFQIPGTLNISNGVSVVLGGTAKAKNIFWQVGGTGVTLGTGAHIEGVVLSKTLITLGVGATASSRLLAQTAVTLGGTVTPPAP
jgi:hypothetical protein